MDRSKLMDALDAAIDVVDAKKTALGLADAEFKAVTDNARLKFQAAQQEHAKAVETAQTLRRQLNDALNAALPAEPSGIQVNR